MLAGTPQPSFGSDIAPDDLIFGVDEAGRGPLAGPVVAAAVVLCKPLPDELASGLDDSKKLSAKKRGALDIMVQEHCGWGVGVVDVDQIDTLNILGATMLAMTQAVAQLAAVLGHDPRHVLIDGNLTPQGRCDQWRWDGRPIIGGDGIEPCISAASIVAKEWRDRMMVAAAKEHPQYGWDRNKGYGSREHMAALRLHGPTPLHRRSFAPVAQLSLI
ncbi:ribonuclease HII [Parerythrobacter jejuensis]|uniref:Ribonuclease HII n=1 Tax=Parerythrobacter jejuensis TaxID=795812 RepID=A0A845AQR5_9SPHN|nr:ribonuclease HII [Parerythrobacter jejuensis]MXP31737.1 ribonuclease HII [Parerythrobacter jejuensis]